MTCPSNSYDISFERLSAREFFDPTLKAELERLPLADTPEAVAYEQRQRMLAQTADFCELLQAARGFDARTVQALGCRGSHEQLQAHMIDSLLIGVAVAYFFPDATKVDGRAGVSNHLSAPQ